MTTPADPLAHRLITNQLANTREQLQRDAERLAADWAIYANDLRSDTPNAVSGQADRLAQQALQLVRDAARDIANILLTGDAR